MRDDLRDIPDEVWNVLGGVASEIDGLPVGDERRFWDPEVLKRKDLEIEDYRQRARQVIVQAFEKLLCLLTARGSTPER